MPNLPPVEWQLVAIQLGRMVGTPDGEGLLKGCDTPSGNDWINYGATRWLVWFDNQSGVPHLSKHYQTCDIRNITPPKDYAETFKRLGLFPRAPEGAVKLTCGRCGSELLQVELKRLWARSIYRLLRSYRIGAAILPEDFSHMADLIVEVVSNPVREPEPNPFPKAIDRPDEAHNPPYEGLDAFVPGLGTVRECRRCGCLIAGGPTACKRCAAEKP